MRVHPASRHAVAVFCLLLVAAAGVAFGAVPPKARPASRTRHSRGLQSWGDPTKGDIVGFDDPVIRQSAVEALGHANGSVVAIDPATGRILTVVNQKMAFGAGFEPCSTIKPVIALAGLQQGTITRDTMIQVGHRRYMGLTEAMAHSNNKYFEEVGSNLGFDTVLRYARMVGLGERAGFDIPEEKPGQLPSHPSVWGGVARMSSFGQGIRMTPLQLASLVGMLANNGTQYYLQYPRSAEQIQNFAPRVRQQLDIAALLPDLQEGMLAAVEYGTARQSYEADEQALGKTGTCNDESQGGRLGWFVSYADQAHPKIVLVVLLRGGSRVVSGPHAAEIAGRIYNGLRARNYFATDAAARRPQYNAANATASGSSH
jgi:penicillin-binding protein 2